MFKILVDTCVWLDIAKDYQQQAQLSAPPAKEPGTRYAFVTHNTKDFSHPASDNKLPHPDIATRFSRIRSLYFIKLGEALRRISPDQFADLPIKDRLRRPIQRDILGMARKAAARVERPTGAGVAADIPADRST